MKIIGLITLLISFSMTVLGGPLEKIIKENPTCYGGIQATDSFLGIISNPMQLALYDLNNGKSIREITTETDIRDFELKGDYVYILTDHGFDVHDIVRAVAPRHIELGQRSGYNREITIVQDKIFVARNNEFLEVFDLNSHALLADIELKGRIVSISDDIERLYVQADTTGLINGIIHNSIFIINKMNLKLEKETKVYTNPTDTIDVKGDKVFLGNRFYWQLEKKKVLSKKFISTYKSVFIPKMDPIGKPFRNATHLYYCEAISKSLKMIERKSIER